MRERDEEKGWMDEWMSEKWMDGWIDEKENI